MLRATSDPPSAPVGTAPLASSVAPAPAAVSPGPETTAEPAPCLSQRRPIRSPEAYEVSLPEWLRECLRHAPPYIGAQPPPNAEALLASAFDYAFQLHEGQFRASGEPYIVHPVAVADLLRDIGASAAVIAAGFLHDVVEDTQLTPEELEVHFGAEVRALVEGVTKLSGIHFTNYTEAQADNLRRMFLAMASDIRVVLVKLADRLHNMRTIGALKPEKQQRIARETREIYAPSPTGWASAASSGSWRIWPSRCWSPRRTGRSSSRWPASAASGRSGWG
jgi:guanosine-3',5'-bis(diphosphate) 3'-pyrophosphohydrolase